MYSKKVRELTAEWDKYDFTYNAYGPQIPMFILYDSTMIRQDKRHRGNTLADFKQNGFITECIYNDRTKDTYAERDNNPVVFTKIFRDLRDCNELMPSHYVYRIYQELEAHNRNKQYDSDYYIKTVCRGLRAFASFLREIDLQEWLNEYLTTMSRIQKVSYHIMDSSANDDINGKADILLSYNGQIVRTWSYQTTQAGINKTSHRIVDDDGKPRLNLAKHYGLHLLMPFSFTATKAYCGWYFYNEDVVRHTLIDLLVNPHPISYDTFYKEVYGNRNAVNTPVLFEVA